MTAPRIFVSSTYYDLKYIRTDIESFIKNLGYEPVLHEKNKVTYTQTQTLEDSCYNEISTCDILICIIGNKFGTQSESNDYSITMNELEQAIRDQKKIYVFIQKDVSLENRVYNLNKDIPDFKTAAADNVVIHQFINELRQKNNNFPIQDFESVSDITNSIQAQFAGLFQNLLQKEATLTDNKTYYDLAETSSKIKELVSDFEKEKDSFFKKFNSTLYANNTLMTTLSEILNFEGVDLFIRDRDSLVNFLENIGYTFESNGIKYDFSNELVFTKVNMSQKNILTISNDIFKDIPFDDEIEIFRSFNKAASLITLETEEVISTDDELPF